MDGEVLDKLKDFIDTFESVYGEAEGFEIKLEHPIVEGEGIRQGFANIKEFVVLHLVRETMEVK